MKQIKITLVALFLMGTVNAQNVDKKILNWYNGAKFGMHTDKAYSKLLAGKKSTTVVVAVIDSGVDIEHEDLKGQIWSNEGEIAGNGIDDDGNGYIDDIHGWNFLGNAEGVNINDVRLEVTRIYSEMDVVYKGKEYADLTKEEKEGYALYKKVKEEVTKVRTENETELKDLEELTSLLKGADRELTKHFKGTYAYSDLKKLKKDPILGGSANQMMRLFDFGMDYSDYKEMLKYYQDELDFNYNPAIDERAKYIGDDPKDFSDMNYGNNDVEGPDAGHGTHCSGIIGAVRNNETGNDGVATNVKIMSLRAVPNGDEWDKDIALAIRYAVDNGAQVINMSFGKSYSPQQDGVIEAIRYAEEKGVLLVHAAGNEAADNDITENYPRPQYASMSSKFTNWIEVGASTRFKKAKYKKDYLTRDGLAADFSNYGDQMVDVYAPGHDIYSTVPQSDYDIYDGTSMAAPMVVGVAALLKSYYPSLTMLEIREIIFMSVQKTGDRTTPLPGDPTVQVSFNELCVTEGIVNVYNAVLMAEKKAK